MLFAPPISPQKPDESAIPFLRSNGIITTMSAISKRVYYHDTDSGGVVYYANYLKYFEEGRTEYMRACGIDIGELMQAKNVFFVVRHVEIDYKAPARYGDELTVETKVVRVKNVSMIFTQEIRRGGQLLVSAETVLVCINKEFHPTVIPEDVARCLA